MVATANVVQSGACTTPRRPPWRSGIPSPGSHPGRAQRRRRRREKRSIRGRGCVTHHNYKAEGS
eukprot:1336167-Pleurochrysis_carterae.AAC.1